MPDYYVYILAGEARELYVGVTGNLVTRIWRHRMDIDPGSYTAKHKTKRLVYFEATSNVLAAIGREKQIKGWTRQKKLKLTETLNPNWNDLADGW